MTASLDGGLEARAEGVVRTQEDALAGRDVPNAALLAIQILAVTDPDLARRLAEARGEWQPRRL